MEQKKFYIILLIVVIAVGAADTLFGDTAGASVLVPLIFWSGIAQGLIALLAAIEISEGRWAGGLKGVLRDYYPILLIFPFLFLLMSGHMVTWAWAEHPGRWLNEGFFLLRNFTALLLPFIFARLLVRSQEKENGKSRLFAGLYILAFVISQSFLAYDVVMTVEYPWINTLFGGYFAVESLYAGIAFASILAASLFRNRGEAWAGILKDTANMVMGFALLWVGLFFSQYLVIWYGNLPEEVAFIEKRLEIPALKYLGLYLILSLFVIPFLSYVSRKAKSLPPAVRLIAVIVLSGYFLEKILLLLPTARLNTLFIIIATLLLGTPFFYLIGKQRQTNRD